MSSGPIIEVAAGLVFHHGRVLLARRRAADHQGGLWEFPGGKRQAGESFEECLRRELIEELAIDVVVRDCIEDLTHAYPDRTVRLMFFRCALDRGQPQCHGCDEIAWVGPSDLDRFAFPAADARLIARLQTRSELWLS